MGKNTRVGISIITSTKRLENIENVFDNYNKQKWRRKELIIIINRDETNIEKYRKKARKYKDVTVYQLPENKSLGECLNFGVDNAKYDYVAKFDDDDYYAPHYLTESMRTFQNTNADIVGKYTYYVYLEGSNLLLLRSPKNENKFVSSLPGATMVIKKEVFNKVRFPDRNLGEDSKFCGDCGKLGFKMFSGGRYNFVAVRKKNAKGHTWPISDQKLVSSSPVLIIPLSKNFREYVSKSSDFH